MDGSDSHGHKQVNDRQHKAFQILEADCGYTRFLQCEAFLLPIVRFIG